MSEINFIVEGMECGHCAAAVEKALKDLQGVESVKVDLDDGIARVELHNGDTDLGRFKQAVKEAGYKIVGTK